MAEVFGVVAGAVPIATLVVEQALKLKRLLGRVKDAPVTVRRLLVELQIFADTLAALDEVYRKESELATSHLSDHITALCRGLHAQLETLLLELSDNMKNKPTFSWAAFKAVMKRDRINDLSDQMERAMRFLSTTKTLNQLSKLIDQGPLSQTPLQNLTLNEERSPMSSQQQLVSTSRAPLSSLRWSTPASYWLLLGTLFISKGELSVKDEQTAFAQSSVGMWKLNFNPARWLPLGGWQQTLRFYRTIAYDSEILDACYYRDIACVRRLFIEGVASPFDRDMKGRTLLHHAARWASPAICQLLIDCGADANEVDENGFTPLLLLSDTAYDFEDRPDEPHTLLSDRPDAMSTMKILVEKGRSDPMIGQSSEIDDFPHPSALHAWRGSYEGFLWLIQQEHFYIDLKTYTPGMGLNMYAQQALNLPSAVGLSPGDPLREELISRVREEGDTMSISFINLVLFRLIRMACNPDAQFWRERIVLNLGFVLDLVEAGCDLFGDDLLGWSISACLLGRCKGFKFAYENWPGDADPKMLLNGSTCEICPLSEINRNCSSSKTSQYLPGGTLKAYEEQDRELYTALAFYRDTEMSRHHAFREWFQILVRAGINLHEYARKVEELHPEGHMCVRAGVSDRYSLCTFYKFHYGENEADLEISWHDVWDTIPDYLPVPGAWEDEGRKRQTEWADVLAEFCVKHGLVLTLDGPSHTYTFTSRYAEDTSDEDCSDATSESEWEDCSENGENRNSEPDIAEAERAPQEQVEEGHVS